MNSSIYEILENIKSPEDIKPGTLPGYLFLKLIEFRRLRISPFDAKLIGQLCYYLRLGPYFFNPTKSKKPLDSLKRGFVKQILRLPQELNHYILKPKKSVVVQTAERIMVSKDLLIKIGVNPDVQTAERIMVSKDLLIKIGVNPEFKKDFLGCVSNVLTHPESSHIKPIRFSVCLTNFGERPIKLVPGSPLFSMIIEKLPYPVI